MTFLFCHVLLCEYLLWLSDVLICDISQLQSKSGVSGQNRVCVQA